MLKLRRASNLQPFNLNPDKALGAGGEGNVFAVDNRLAAKIYRKPSESTQRKLRAMLTQNPYVEAHSRVAWPLDLLLDETDQIVGFLMLQAVDARPIVDYYNPKSRLSHSPFFSYRDLHRTAQNLALAVENLHGQGYVVGDLNESNILVTQTAQVTLVDADSIQVIDGETIYRCPVAKAEFMPPELQGQNLSETIRTDEQDNFALAILIFQTLMEGSHPFAGIYTGEGEPPTLAHRIAAGHFPYSNQSVPYHPSPLALPLSVLHPKLQELFLSCFVGSYESPQTRPTASQWCEALASAEKELRTCKVNFRHTYNLHFDTCPWCHRKALLNGRDPFPEKVDFPKVQAVATISKNLVEVAAIIGAMVAFLITLLIALGLFNGKQPNTVVGQSQMIVNPNGPIDPIDASPYLIASVKSLKVQVHFCKNGNWPVSMERATLWILKDFEPEKCPPSPLKVAGDIFKHIYPYSYTYRFPSRDETFGLHSNNDETVILDKSYDTRTTYYNPDYFIFDANPVLMGNVLSPNGLYFASIMDANSTNKYNNEVLILDTHSQKILQIIKGPNTYTASVLTFSPNSKMLAVGQLNGIVKIYSVKSGNLIREIKVDWSSVIDLKFLSNGKILRVGVRDGGFQLISIPSGKTIGTYALWMKKSYLEVTTLAFSPDQKRVAVSYRNPRTSRGITKDNSLIFVYDTHSGKVLRNLIGGHSTNFMIFSKDSKKLAVENYLNNLNIYDLKL